MTDINPETVKAALKAATQGRRVQFHPHYCREAEGAPFCDWDSSHDTSIILADGTRYKYATHRHAVDATLDAMAFGLATTYLAQAAENERLRKRVRAMSDGLVRDLLDYKTPVNGLNPPVCKRAAYRITALEAECDALAGKLGPLATEARCRCMYESRETERAYENGECDHQRARATLAQINGDKTDG